MKKTKSKPPVVVILGHVDHGKTTLLDRIRKSNIGAGEFGGITQKIGAYQVKLPTPNSELKTITFIDTPGHEAFTKMRSRGAKIADLAILVVAANDGIMPQTKESIKYIKETKIPFLVAINKIDLPDTTVEKTKSQLAENEVVVEDYGGKIVSVSVSGKTGQGINELLETILLLAEMEELKSNPEGKLEAVIIESKLDKRRGPIATILVQNGTLKINDQIKIKNLVVKIKAMFDENGKKIKKAEPSTPVEILGFKTIPAVGTKITKVDLAISTSSTALHPLHLRNENNSTKKNEDNEKKLKIILKTDTTGSLEAVLDSFSDDVFVVQAEVSNVNQSDIDLAKIGNIQIFTLNVKTSPEIKKLAESENIQIRNYKIIYKLLEEIEKQVLKILEPTIDEKVLGKAKIIAEFEMNGVKIAGARVTEGKISKLEKIHLIRNKEIINDGKLISMKNQKDNIDQAGIEQEFGAVFSPSLDFKIGDVIMSYKQAS